MIEKWAYDQKKQCYELFLQVVDIVVGAGGRI